MTIEETRARQQHQPIRDKIQKVRETHSSDPDAMKVVADALDAILDRMIDKAAIDSFL